MDRVPGIVVRVCLCVVPGAWWLAGGGVPTLHADIQTQWYAQLQRVAAANPAVDAAGAVDGTIAGDFGFHTDRQDSPWWQVDLGAPCALDRVVVFNRTVAAERARTLQVHVSMDAVTWRTVYEHDGTVFFGQQDQRPLIVPLAGVEGRYVRLQVREDTWMHLDEVQVFGRADTDQNLALGKPATQSSVSSWSRKQPAAAGDFVPTDLKLGQRVLDELLEPCGMSAVPMRRRVARLVEENQPLDNAAWCEVFDESRRLGQRCTRIRQQWQRLDLTALRLAINDLLQSYGPRYADGTTYLARLDTMEPQLEAITTAVTRGDPDGLGRAEDVLALQRDALLANPLLDFDQLLLVKRSESAPALGLPANFNGNEALPRSGYDDELTVSSPLHPDGSLTTLYRPGGKFVGDVDLDFSGRRILFSSLDEQHRWRVFEIGADGRGLRQPLQVEEPDVDNYDACYLPDGKILFGSTSAYLGVPCVFGSSHVANLHVGDEETGEIRRLTFDQEHDWNPTVLPDGRVMYLRWEYTDLAHPNSRILFAMNPDGTRQMAFYGSNSYFPNSFFYARPIPDGSSPVVGIATGHHGTQRSGRMLIVDPALGRDEANGVVQEIPGRGRRVEAIVRDRLVDGVWPQFIHPYPLGDSSEPTTGGKYFLVSARPSASAPWGIYLVDIFDNMTLIKELPGFALFEPVPLKPRSTPPTLVNRTDRSSPEATVYLVDVYRGGGLAGVPRGEVKRLRVISYYFGSRGVGGLLGSIGMDGPWDIKQVLGTVPVQEDGSALFKIPANTPVAVQPLDGEGKALQQMRSWFVGMPGEVVSCVGCHERPNDATVNQGSLALERGPTAIEPWYGPRRGFSFAREVQPVLDHYCVQCHDATAGRPDLRGQEIIKDWSSQIAGNVGAPHGGKFSVAYAELHRFVRRSGIESDMHMLSPLDFHADTTELIQLLRQGHYQVQLDRESWDRLVTWIDLNAPYHGTWSEIIGSESAMATVQRRRDLERAFGQVDVDWEYIGPVATLSAPNAPPAAAATDAVQPSDSAASLSPPELARTEGAARVTRSVELAPGVTLDLVLVPAGTVTMSGDPATITQGTASLVEIGKSYWMGTCEVTNRQYACFDPGHDSRLESRHGYQFGRLGYPLNEPEQPVVRVSWNEAQAFCEWLGAKLGVRCTLPTEAQWEQACRAGTATPFFFGDRNTDFSSWANLGDRSLMQYAACTAHDNYSSTLIIPNPSRYDDWVPKDDRFDDGSFVSAAVGSYRPNAWGLHDMHGNVWEWTLSADVAFPYRDDDGRNDVGGNQRRIVRGGSWYDRPQRAESGYRLSYRPYQRVFNVGFRVVVDADWLPGEPLLSVQ